MNPTYRVILDIQNERHRQITTEGWTPEHDDKHTDGSLAQAAACYAHPDMPMGDTGIRLVPYIWPVSWSDGWWKPKSRRQNLIRAAALIVAEIERIDRAEAAANAPSRSQPEETRP